MHQAVGVLRPRLGSFVLWFTLAGNICLLRKLLSLRERTKAFWLTEQGSGLLFVVRFVHSFSVKYMFVVCLFSVSLERVSSGPVSGGCLGR